MSNMAVIDNTNTLNNILKIKFTTLALAGNLEILESLLCS